MKFNSKDLPFNVAIFFTYLRIFSVPFIVFLYYLPFSCFDSFIVFILILSSLTDFLDGWLARFFQQETKFGAFLDLLADKVTIVTSFVLIVEKYHVWWITLPVLIALIREILILFLRIWTCKENNITVLFFGKIKTAVQMISLIGLLWKSNEKVERVAFALLYLSFTLTLFSMLLYFHKFFQFVFVKPFNDDVKK